MEVQVRMVKEEWLECDLWAALKVMVRTARELVESDLVAAMMAKVRTKKVDPEEYGRGVVRMVRAQTAEVMPAADDLLGAIRVRVTTAEHDLEAALKGLWV